MHPIDNFFEKKLKHQSFDVEPVDWENMKILLEEEEKSRKRIVWFWFLSGVAVLIAIIGIGNMNIMSVDDNIEKNGTDVAHIDHTESRAKILDTGVNSVLNATNTILSEKNSDDITGVKNEENIINSNLIERRIKNGAVSSFREGTSTRESYGNIPSLNEQVWIYNEGNRSEKIIDDIALISLEDKTVVDEIDAVKIKRNDIFQLKFLPSLFFGIKYDDSGLKEDYLANMAESLREHKDRIITFSIEDPMVNSVNFLTGMILYPYKRDGGVVVGYRYGVSYTHALNDHFGASIGLGMSLRSGNSGISEETMVTNYNTGLGWDRDYMSLTPTKIYHLELPVFLQGKKLNHTFSVGASLNFAAGVRGVKKVESYNQAELAGKSRVDVVANSIQEDKIWMTLDAFNPVHLQARAYYRYQISPKFDLGFGVDYNINNLSKGDLLIDNNSLKLMIGAEVNLWK